MKKKFLLALIALVSAASFLAFSASADTQKQINLGQSPNRMVTYVWESDADHVVYGVHEYINNGNLSFLVDKNKVVGIHCEVQLGTPFRFDEGTKYRLRWKAGGSTPNIMAPDNCYFYYRTEREGTVHIIASVTPDNTAYSNCIIDIPDNLLPHGVSVACFGMFYTYPQAGRIATIWCYKYITIDVRTPTDEIIDNQNKNKDEIVANQNKNKDEIIANQEKNKDEIMNEDYGYTKPTNPEMDSGLEAGGNLLDQMTSTVDEFNKTIDEKTQTMIDNVTKVKPLVDGVFNIIPLPITLCITGVVVFLVVRKVVGR